jgi:hypothetical protein
LGAVDVHRVYAVLLRRFRRRRMRAFARTFEPDGSTTILDVGGSPYNWRLVDVPGRLVLVNLEAPRSGEQRANGHFVVASGTALSFADGAFDVAFSNSVIEHLGSFERQAAFARELSRVGRGVFVQTPARRFFFEPHLLTPFVHWLPRRWQRRLLRNFTVWGWLARPTPEQIERHLCETRLLDLAELRRLFPDCEVRRERFLGLTKSYVAVRHAEPLR